MGKLIEVLIILFSYAFWWQPYS